MVSAWILIADGSEELEFVTAYDVLVRAGFDVKSIGVNLKSDLYAECSRRVKICPDVPSIQDFSAAVQGPLPDILVLPGGAAGAATFCASEATLQLINRFREGRWVGCICAATTALVAAMDVIKDEGGSKTCKVTSHPSVKAQILEKGWEYSEDRVVVDGKVITSRGPGTALLFALTIVENLIGKEKRNEVAEPMIVAETL